MKLFKQLLVAPAALGLMAPMAVNADSLPNGVEAGAFSATTQMSGTAFFTTGSVGDGGAADNQEELYMQYAYELNLDSTFTGEDNLHVGIEAGNASGPLAGLDSAIDSGDGLEVASMFYAFPVGQMEVTVGPKLLQDDVLAATTSAYSDSFRLGAMPFSQAGEEEGPGIAVSYANDNGWVASASYISVDGTDSTVGISGDGQDVSTLTLGWNGDNGFGGGIAITSNDGEGTTNGVANNGYDTFGGGVYYTPDSIPATISVSFDTTDPEVGNDSTDLFIGVDYSVGAGTLSAAYNTTDVDGGSDDLDTTGFEVSYSYPLNDYVTITPGFYSVENNNGADDDNGVVVETAFSF